jgi:hypothetical protein
LAIAGESLNGLAGEWLSALLFPGTCLVQTAAEIPGRNSVNLLPKYRHLGFKCRNTNHFISCCNFEQSLPE